jgi:hypothetical protein
MSSIARIPSLACIMAFFALAGCTDDTSGDPWEFEQPQPESTVDQSLCTQMPGADLEKPTVAKLEGGDWRVRYPAFSEGCGVYQLDAILDVGETDDIRLTYEPSVCNRCEEPQQVNYLYQYGGWMAEPPSDRYSVPDQPNVTSVPALLYQGRPIVRLGAARDETDGCPDVSYGLDETHSYPSYSHLWRVALEPGASSERSETRGDEETFEKLATASNSNTESFRIYWPRTYHRDVHITGLQAASDVEFCERDVYYGETIFDRPYAEPYRLEPKYVRQTSPPVELPEELAQLIRASIDETRP